MAGKARVHELAKELGVTSREILAQLADQGERVKSASSTVEAPVARRLRAMYANNHTSRSQRLVREDGRAKGTTHIRPRSGTDRKAPSPERLTASQAATVRKAYREAYAAENHSDAINKVYLKYEALYGVSRETLREVVAVDRERHAPDYAALRKLHNEERQAKQQQKHQKQQATGKALDTSVRESTAKPPDASVGELARPRNRLADLPEITADIHLEAVADVILSKDGSWSDRDEINACLQPFNATGIDGYGYLAWRYSAHRRRRSELPSRTVDDDLAAIAQVIDAEKQLLDEIASDNGAFLDYPSLAKRALDREFHDLIDSEDIGRSAADELRRVRANTHFLRRALVLTIASPDCAECLWEMLVGIRPPTRSQLIETTPSLMAAIDWLNDQISAVEALLSAGDPALGRFFQRSRSELVAIQAGRFDYLQQFHDVGNSPSGVSRQVVRGLPFTVLPEGEQLRKFLGGLRSSEVYRGHQVDARRLTVLEDLQEHFGADLCDWYEGSESSRGVDNHYLVLAIRSAKGFGENAVAISPLAGQHATYVVRHECAEAHWATIFADPKLEARLRGARRLLFKAPDPRTDRYTAMRDKVITLLECNPHDFHKPLVFDHNSDSYRLA